MSPQESLLCAAPMVGLAFLVLAHAVVRRSSAKGLLLPFVATVLAGAAVVIALSSASVRAVTGSHAEAAARVLLNLLTYLGLAFGYFNFVNLNVTSLRIRLLHELSARGAHGMPREELLDRYGTRHVIQVRLERLSGSGHLVCRDGRYYTGKRGVIAIARIFDVLTWLVLPSGAKRRLKPEKVG